MGFDSEKVSVADAMIEFINEAALAALDEQISNSTAADFTLATNTA
jgi:hypothetical protein